VCVYSLFTVVVFCHCYATIQPLTATLLRHAGSTQNTCKKHLKKTKSTKYYSLTVLLVPVLPNTSVYAIDSY